MRFPEFITGSNKGKTLAIVDIDDTIFETFAQILVIKDGKVVKRLNNQEFNRYILGPGETFDFSEFRDAKLFYKTSKPIQRMIERLKTMIKLGFKVILLTARADFNDKETFLATFKKYDINPDDFYVERAGNLVRGTIPERKLYIIVKKYISSGLYRKIFFYDDYIGNCKQFLKLKTTIPNEILDKIKKINNVTDGEILTIRAYQVLKDGSIVEVK